jgi:hypothetical protein
MSVLPRPLGSIEYGLPVTSRSVACVIFLSLVTALFIFLSVVTISGAL